MKIIFASLLTALVFVCSVDAVYACSCPKFVPPGEVLTREQEIKQLLESDGATVFAGEVTSIIPDADQPYFRDVTFSVDQYWAGIVPSEITVRSFQPSAACSVDLRLGASYLMFAKAYQNGVYADDCFGIQELEKAAEDLNHLGKGKQPVVKKPQNN